MYFPGGKMNFKAGLLLLVTLFATTSVSQAADLIYKGKAPQINLEKSQSIVEEVTAPAGREEISWILRSEAGVKTVNEAIALKTRGLQFVRDIYDFEYLTSCPFTGPSEAYIKAVGDFIAQHVANYVYSVYDLNVLRVLEARAPHVTQAMTIKSAGLRIRMQIGDYLQLIPPSISNPSEAYKKAISEFTAKNISYVLDYYSPIYLIIEAEKFTITVADAMMVKRAGLVAVQNRHQLFELATYSVPNPSASYQQAVNAFVSENLNRFPY